MISTRTFCINAQEKVSCSIGSLNFHSDLSFLYLLAWQVLLLVSSHQKVLVVDPEMLPGMAYRKQDLFLGKGNIIVSGNMIPRDNMSSPELHIRNEKI